MKHWTVLALLVSATAISQVGASVDSTLERLAKVDRFAFGPTGYAGATSQGENDYKVVLSRPSAETDLERLFAMGNPQAKSYALVGIRALAPARWKELFRTLQDAKEKVVTQYGCIVYHEPLGTVLKRIEAGDYSKTK